MAENMTVTAEGQGAGEGGAPLQLRVFGALELTGRPGLEALLAQPKRVALLIYLALATPRGFHRRDKLVGLFWPEHDQEHARAALRKAVFEIRKHVGEGVVVSRGDEELGVDRAQLVSDADAFDEALKQDRLARAVELHDRGVLLEGFFADAPGFERWLESERRRYSDRAVDALIELMRRYEGERNMTMAARYARKLGRLPITDERTLRKALEMLDRAGDKAGALRVYEEFRKRLKAEFAVEPAAETRALVEEIRRR